jgi:hypothetical protein
MNEAKETAKLKMHKQARKRDEFFAFLLLPFDLL